MRSASRDPYALTYQYILRPSVDYGRIGLQAHTDAQAVDKYRRDAVALFRYRGLFSIIEAMVNSWF